MIPRISFVLVFLLALPAFGLDVAELQQKLGSRNASWQAGENPITALSPEERKSLFGAPLPSHFDQAVFEPADPEPTARRAKRPEFLDWRNHHGTRYASPILNQGRCGSCVAFASVYQLETQMNITNGTAFNAWEFSPQHLFSCGGGACSRGWQPSSAVSFLKSKGVVDEACFPYQSGAMGNDMSCSAKCSGASGRTLKIVSSSRPTYWFTSVDSIKKALQKGPVMAVFKVYEDFLYYKSGVYKHVTGSAQGGHAVTIVGWNNADRAWIVANSWGDTWGEKGFFRISWDDSSGLGRSTWAIKVPKLSGYVTAGDLRDGQVLSGTVSLAPQSTFMDTERIQWKLSQGRKALKKGTVVESLNTEDYPDGRYEIQASAVHASGTSLSHIRRVGILNGTLSGQLEFTNLKEGDSLTGKKVLEIEVASEPVDFESIEFVAEPLDHGGQPLVIGSTNVASRLKLSWRTKKIPNGDYRVSLRGKAGSQTVSGDTLRVTINN